MTNTFVKSCCLVWYGWMVLSALYIIMNDEVSRNSHGHHGSTHRELVQHTLTWIAHIQSHTYINTRITCCEAPAQLLFFRACWVFSCFRNAPNSDMDYRIFKVHTWSFLCVCIHTGVGHTDSESAQHFWLGKTHNFFLCSWWDLNLRPLNLVSDALLVNPPHHPYIGWLLGSSSTSYAVPLLDWCNSFFVETAS